MNHRQFRLDGEGRVAAAQQTRAGAFLISAHGAAVRQLLAALPGPVRDAAHAELHAQFCRESEIVSLLARSVSWTFDPLLPFLWWQWEMTWLPQPPPGAGDTTHAGLLDLAAFAHALHAAIRPARALPEAARPDDPFAVALMRIEAESSRLMQAQILFLKSPALQAPRDVVTQAVERRHQQVSRAWNEMMASLP